MKNNHFEYNKKCLKFSLNKSINENTLGIIIQNFSTIHNNSKNKVKAIIMAWNSIDKSREAANKGFKSILSPYSHVYIDFMQVPADKTIIDEPYYGGWGDNHVNTIEEVYSLNPIASLAGKEEFCMGVQGNMWTETCNNKEELEYQMLPRLLALSETGWLPAAEKKWHSFYNRLQTHDEILDALGYTYAKHYILPKELNNEEKNLIAGQLYFFRAWLHFMVMEWWGGMPYIDHVLPADQTPTLNRLTWQECAEKCAADLDHAANLLPVDWDQTTVGKNTLGKNDMRANKIMALAYKGKILLWAGSPLMNSVSGGAKAYNTELCKRGADALAQALKLTEQTGRYELASIDQYNELFFIFPGFLSS